MIDRAFRFIMGYAEFTVQGKNGDATRFFNVTSKSGFSFWDFKKDGDFSGASCRLKDYKKLRPYARRCRVVLKCRKKAGVPFYIKRLLARKGLVLGAALGIALFWYLSTFVWGVSVSGTQMLSDNAVLKAARESGVYAGGRKSGFTPKTAEHNIISLLPELKFAAVNTNGCFIEIAVSESEQAPEFENDDAWSNIVAKRAGIIVSVEAQRGRPEVQLGDVVEEGQLLISGLYKERLKPYAPPPVDIYEEFGPARGKVKAETFREFSVCVSENVREAVDTGERKELRYLILFGVRIPLGLNIVPDGECRSFVKTTQLTALGVTLPAALERDVYAFTEHKTRKLTESELKSTAYLKLREAQRSQLPEGSEIVSEDISLTCGGGMCVITAKCRCIEEIGEIKTVSVKGTN